MKITTLFFGITTDLVGASKLEIIVDKNTSVQHFKNLIKEKYPTLEDINAYAVAVNESYAIDTVILKEGDTIAIIPPVSGG